MAMIVMQLGVTGFNPFFILFFFNYEKIETFIYYDIQVLYRTTKGDVLNMVNLKITKFEKGSTTIVSEPNKMWDDDVVTTSSRISYEVDGCDCGAYVVSDNVDDAIEEIIPKVILNEFFEHEYKFEELGLPNPEYETYDDGNGVIKDVVEFLNLRCGDICLINEDDVIEDLINKGRELFDVVVV